MQVCVIDTRNNKHTIEVEMNERCESILNRLNLDLPYKVLLCKVDHVYRDLRHKITHECTIELLDMRNNYAWLTYQNTLVMVYKKAVYDVIGMVQVDVLNSLNKGLFTKLRCPITKEIISKIENRMHEIVDLKLPIIKEHVSREEVMKLSNTTKYKDKFQFLEAVEHLEDVEIFSLENQKELFYGLLLPNTSYLDYFELVKYRNGILLRYPHNSKPDVMPAYEDQKLLYDAFSEATLWERLMGVNFVSDLNNKIKSNEAKDMVMLQEALHEKKISDIADRIKKEGKHVVLITGPSSSGKTSFAKKLCIHLRVIGLKPLYLGTDDFFLNRDETPLDENGEKDFENVTAIDIDLFNKQINDLLEGKQVDIPRFNFITGKKEFGHRITSIDKDSPIVIEGTHALNEILTSQILDEEKFKIYISPLTSLNVNDHNRIPTTDARMLRRLVRDYRTRGCSANKTISDWPKVRKGEDLYIFPYTKDADVFFNTNYVYELALLKKYAYPLLESVTRDTPEYGEAQRMMSFLRFFKVMEEDDCIANNSILREFIGGSVLLDE